MSPPIAFTREAARAYDAHCMRDLGIAGLELMENAARGCTRIAREMVADRAAPRVLVACGAGQNGGDGYAVARMLHEAGVACEIVHLGAPDAASDAGIMRRLATESQVVMRPFDPAMRFTRPDLVVDALFGTGLDRPLAGNALAFVRWINALGAPVLSVDLPSGMDCDTGRPLPECVRATVTATMVAPKLGFAAPHAARETGRVEVVPIGGPAPR
ncbi:MAG: NAD(P)H-hydrate epimerase [Planctomycetota bacterium]